MVGRANCVIVLRSEGVSLVLDVTRGAAARDHPLGRGSGTLGLADVQGLILSNIDPAGSNVVDEPCVSPSCRSIGRVGWGRPGLSGSGAGRAWSPKFTTTEVRVDGEQLAPLRTSQP